MELKYIIMNNSYRTIFRKAGWLVFFEFLIIIKYIINNLFNKINNLKKMFVSLQWTEYLENYKAKLNCLLNVIYTFNHFTILL